MKHTKLILAIVLIIAMNSKAQSQKPNIILILADDVGYKSLTCNGGNLYSTPNIDKLAQKGMRFTQCHASSGCSPSRFMLLTGKYNFRNYTGWGKMDIDQKTIGNMMKDAGYKTACFGKWQLGGGDQSIHQFGFDSYAVHDALDKPQMKSRYKNPHIYTDGSFLPDSLTLNKYGPDIFTDSVLKFIEKNKSNPFFIYYPMILAHSPFAPTPDDAAFDTWDPNAGNDTAFFSSMMGYMDKEVGQIINKVESLGMADNTVIIFSGDNGTPSEVPDYSDDDTNILGGKHSLTERGIHVPLIVYWKGIIKAGSLNNDLIDFTDFFPTLAGLINTPMPSTYGPLDGISFFPRLIGQAGTPRDWIFNQIDRHPGKSIAHRWAQTKTYKLYDTCASKSSYMFYNIKGDVNEEHPIASDSLTAREVIIRQQLLDVITNYVAQGTPIISMNPDLSFVTDSSFILADTIRTNGESTITDCGAVWSTSPNPKISSSNYSSTNVMWGPFSTQATGLKANTTYYVRAYATNFAGTAYSNQISFKTSLEAPVATKATAVDSNKFTANWKAYADATNYRLDVSTSPTFTKMISSTINEGFDNGIILPSGWTNGSTAVADTSSFGKASPSLLFTKSKTQLMTKQLTCAATQLKFWMKGLNMDDASSLLVEGFDGNTWDTIATLSKLPEVGTTTTYNANSNPRLKPGFIQFRFTYTKNIGKLFFDDVSIEYKKPVPFFIPGYNDLLVKTNSRLVTGLNPATNYYYRVRAKTEDGSTGNSNVITVTAKKVDSVIDIANYKTSTQMDSSAVNIAKKGEFNIQVFPNPSPGEFILTLQNSKNEKLKIAVIDISGKILYETSTRTDGKYVFGKTFAPGAYFVNVNSGTLNKTLKVIKTK